LADALRLQQVFDNIIGNSYKYAGTDITINSYFKDNFFAISIKDSGAGVTNDELSLLFNKFYRGKNADEKSGYGLGLYISKFLLEQMSGKLRCENDSDGFCVEILLCLA
jgi:signal transduction histidine kinase